MFQVRVGWAGIGACRETAPAADDKKAGSASCLDHLATTFDWQACLQPQSFYFSLLYLPNKTHYYLLIYLLA